MDDKDIKSPLPPRRFSSLYDEQADTDKPADTDAETPPLKVDLPPQPMVSEKAPPPQGPASLSSMSTKKNGDRSKFVIIGVIGLFVLVIIFLIFRVILPGIGVKKTGEVTLNYWGLWEESSIVQGLIADYEAKNPGVKINYVMNQRTNYKSRLQTRLETGGGDDNPDIFRVHATWLPMFNGNMAKVPADTANSIGLDTDYFDTYKNTIKQGGSWMGVPLMYDGLSLFYNKDLIDTGQVSLPKSWWDLEMAANKLTVRDENGRIKIAGAALGLVDNVDHWSDIVGLMLKQGGVDPLVDDEVNNKKLKDVLTFYTLFRTKDHVWDENLPSSTEMFANGKLAFYFAPSWRVFNIEDMKVPDLRYEITTVPQLPTLSDVPLEQANDATNLTNIYWGTYWIEGVNAKSSKQKEAWKFLEFMSTKENLEKFYTTASQVRSFGEIYPRKSMADKVSENSKVKPFVQVANEAVSWYLCSRTFDEGLNDGMSKYFGDAINSMVMKNIAQEQVMSDLRNGIDQIVTKYGLQ